MRLRFWLTCAGESLLATLSGTAVYVFILGLQLSDSFAAMAHMLPVYLVLMGAIMQLALIVAIYKFQLPLALSFGSTRKEAAVGIQIYRLLPALTVSLAAAVLSALLSGEGSPVWVFATALGVLLLGSAAGSVMGMVYLRFGRIATVLTVVILAVCGGIGGAAAVFSPSLSPLFNRQPGLPVLAAGLLFYGIVMLPERKLLRSYSVKL